MVPSAVVVLPALPLTPNGKVDRGALAAAGEAASAPVPRVGPRNPTERAIVAIWEDLLGVTGIGMRDSFFDLGGHSLLAARMIDAVERASGRRVPLAALFETPTIEHLAQALRDEVVASEPPLVALNPSGARPPFFFLHGDFSGGGFFSRALAEALGPEQPFYAVHPHGLVDADVPESIEGMAAERLAVLRAARPRGPYLLGGHCNGGLVALEMARRLREQGEAVPLVVLLDADGAPARGAARLRAGAADRRPAARPADGERADAAAPLARARGRHHRPASLLSRRAWPTSRAGTRARGPASIAGVGARPHRRGARGARGPAGARDSRAARPAGRGQPRRPLRARGAELSPRPLRGPHPRPALRGGGGPAAGSGLGVHLPRMWSRTSVPGDHLGAITRHIRATGARLRECLERAFPA